MSHRKIAASKSTRNKHLDSDLMRELSSGTIKVVGSYHLGGIIGEGSFGKVREAIHSLTGVKVAVKIVDKTHAPTLVREIDMWKRLRHPNIVQLFEVLNTESKIYMIMERSINGEIFDYLMNQTRLAEEEAWRLFRQLVAAVDYCHSKNCVHRDLKLENMLLDEQMNLKLIDFGFTRELEGPNALLETFCGSVAYAAPEMLSGEKYLGPGADIWSMGVILYTLIFGYLPFDDDNEQILQQKIVNVDYHFPEDINISSDLMDLIASMLRGDRASRITMDQIKNHSWITRNFDPEYVMKDWVDEPVNEDLIQAMSILGLDVRNLSAQLTANEINCRTAFYYLIKRQKDLAFNSNSFGSVVMVGDSATLIGTVDSPSPQSSLASESPVASRIRNFSAPNQHSMTAMENVVPVRSMFTHGKKSRMLNAVVAEDSNSGIPGSAPITASNSPFSSSTSTPVQSGSGSGISKQSRAKSLRNVVGHHHNPKTIEEEEDEEKPVPKMEKCVSISSPVLPVAQETVQKNKTSLESPAQSGSPISGTSQSGGSISTLGQTPTSINTSNKDFLLRIKTTMQQRLSMITTSTNSSVSELDEHSSQGQLYSSRGSLANGSGTSSQKMNMTLKSQLYNVRKTSTTAPKEISLEFVRICNSFGIRYRKHGYKFFCQVRIVTKKNEIGRKHGVLLGSAGNNSAKPGIVRRKSDSAMDAQRASYMTFYRGIPTASSKEDSIVANTTNGSSSTGQDLRNDNHRLSAGNAVSMFPEPKVNLVTFGDTSLKELFSKQISPTRSQISQNIKDPNLSPQEANSTVTSPSSINSQQETTTEIIRFEMHIIKIKLDYPINNTSNTPSGSPTQEIKTMTLPQNPTKNKVFGLKFRRISGEQWHYKHICDQIVSDMNV